ncbi:hypothetical protein HMPREF1870_02279 [Bacteroidales bacterium KA00344]|nr:hypothetical protein HMPREF1870_02279 [Bacteroidales bacterium KA00344]
MDNPTYTAQDVADSALAVFVVREAALKRGQDVNGENKKAPGYSCREPCKG